MPGRRQESVQTASREGLVAWPRLVSCRVAVMAGCCRPDSGRDRPIATSEYSRDYRISGHSEGSWLHSFRYLGYEAIMITRSSRHRTFILMAVAIAAVLTGITGCANMHQHSAETDPAGSPTSIGQTQTFSGVGALVEPADASVSPAISATQATVLLTKDGLVQQLIDGLTPAKMLLVWYRNRFGTQLPNGGESPSVPKQLAWFAEYENVKVDGGSRPMQSTTPPVRWNCTYYVAVGATNGKILDAFDFCRPAK